jgi:hypothetical protein
MIPQGEEEGTKGAELGDSSDDIPALTARGAVRMGQPAGIRARAMRGSGDRRYIETSVPPRPVLFRSGRVVDGGAGGVVLPWIRARMFCVRSSLQVCALSGESFMMMVQMLVDVGPDLAEYVGDGIAAEGVCIFLSEAGGGLGFAGIVGKGDGLRHAAAEKF